MLPDNNFEHLLNVIKALLWLNKAEVRKEDKIVFAQKEKKNPIATISSKIMYIC